MEKRGKSAGVSAPTGVRRLPSHVVPPRVRASFLPDGKKNENGGESKRQGRRVTSRKTSQRGNGAESESPRVDVASPARSDERATAHGSNAPIAALLAIAKTAAMTEEVPLKGIILANRRSVFHKTRLCPRLRGNRVFCPLGESCTFAHSEKELRPPPVLDRTKLCPSVLSKGVAPCPGVARGEPCKFAHSKSEIRHTSNMFKTNMCLKWNRGKCKAGAECNHAHGEEELRFYRFLAYSNGTRDFRSEAEVGALRSGRAADEKEGSPSHSSAQGKDAYAGVAQKGAQHASESVAGNQQCRQTCGANVRHASGAARGSWSGSKGVAAVSGRFSGSASPTTTGCMSKSQSVASLSLFKKEGEDWRREDEGTGVSVSGESSGSVLDEAEQQRRHLYEELLAREQEQRRREQASQEEYLRLLLTLAAYAPDLFRSLFLSPNSPGLESEMILNPSQRCPLNVQAKRPSHSADASFAVGDAGEGEEKGAKGEDAASSWRNFLAVLKPDAPFQATPEQSVDNSVLTAALAAAVQSKQKPKEASRPEERPARAEVESLMGPSLFSGAVPQSVDDSLTPRLEVPLHFPLGGRVSTPACRCAGSGTPDSFSTCAGGEDCVERLTNCLQFAASDDKEQGTGTSLPPSPLLFGSQSPAISYESVENASFMSTPPLQGGGLPFSAASWEQRRRGTQVDGAVGPNALFDTVALRAREENLCRGDGVAAQKEGPFGPVQSLFADQESMTFYSDPWRANEERTARDASSLLQAFKPGDTELRDNHWNGQAVELIFAQKTAARAAQRREDKGVEHGQPPASGATLQDALALLQSLGLIADSPKQRCSAGAAETHARG